MKLSVDTAALKAAISIAGRVIQDKTPWPILTNIRLRAEGSTLTAHGTNADITYEADIAAEVETPGEAIVHFGTLSKFVSAAKADTLSLEVEDGNAKVKAGRSRITLHAGDPSEFPNYEAQIGETFAVDRDTFLHALRFCVPAAADDETRYHIAGVNIAEGTDGVDFWSTNSQVAHHARLTGVTEIGGGGQLPQAAATVVAAVADKAEDIRFAIDERGWRVEAGRGRAWGKVVDAKFPNVAGMFDCTWADVALLETDDLSRAIDVAVCGADTSDRVRSVVVRTNGTSLVVRGYRPGAGVVHAGRAEAEADVRDEYAGAINADLLRGALAGMKAPGIVVRSGDLKSGVRALRVAPRQESATLDMEAFLPPMRVSEAKLSDV